MTASTTPGRSSGDGSGAGSGPGSGRHAAPPPGRHRALDAATVPGRHARTAPTTRRASAATVTVCGIAALATVGAVAAVTRSAGVTGTVAAWSVAPSGTVALPVERDAAGAAGAAQPVSAPRGGYLAPADAVATAPAAGPTATVGTELVLGGVLVTVRSARILDASGATGDGTRLAVDLQVRRVGAGPALSPGVELVCAGARDTGNYYADGSYSPARELDRGETLEGTVVLGMPASLGGRACTGAAVRLVDPVPPADDPTSLGPRLEVALPEGVVPAA